MEHKDKLGNEINVGDTIVYAMKRCDSAALQTGTVIKKYFVEVKSRGYDFKDNCYTTIYKPFPKLSVKLSDGLTVTLSKMDRVVVIKQTHDEDLRQYLSEYGKYIFDQRKNNN